LQYSEQFNNAIWSKAGGTTITANSVTAPNGTLTADTFNTSQTNLIWQNLSASNNTTYTLSLWVKLGTATNICLIANNTLGWNTIGGQSFNASNGLNTSTWTRISFTFTTPTLPVGAINLHFGGNAQTGLTQSTGTLFIWGAQLVEGTNALDYFATETRLNIPRLDYSNGSCPSLLVEPQRTNVLKYSQDYSNAVWGKVGITATLGTQINPQGIASTYNIANTTLGDSYLEQQGLPITSGTYTTSVFIKNIDNLATTQLVAVHIAEGSITSELLYTWATNTFVLTGTNAISGKVTPYANGWIRISFTYSIGALTTLHWSRLYANSTLSVTKSALVYGFQTELGSYPTSYIPTTSAAVTRNADVISKTGISSLIGQSEGTIFWDIDDITGTISGTGNPDLGIRNTAFTNWIGLTTNTFAEPFRIVVRPTSGIMIDYTANITRAKAAVKYGSFGAILFVNGVQVATSAVNPNFTFDIVDMSGAIISYRNNSFILWPIALTDGEMSMLTSGVYTPALAYAQLGLVSESPACLTSSVNALL
jgi:hypothetical protein